MESSLLLGGEKLVSTRKISILVERTFWMGLIFIFSSLISFILLSFFGSQFLSLSDVEQTIGIGTGGTFGFIPLIPSIFLFLGFVYILYAELKVFFKEYAVTTSRVMIRSGIINKDLNILLPSKIEDVNVEVNILERILGLGRVLIIMQEDAQRPIVLGGIKEPYKFQGDILNLIGKQTYTKPEEDKDGTGKAN